MSEHVRFLSCKGNSGTDILLLQVRKRPTSLRTPANSYVLKRLQYEAYTQYGGTP